jgi:hypothetical protein
MEILINDTKSETGNTISMKDLFTYLKYPLFIGSALGFFQQFTGINSVIFYSNQIFDQTSDSGDDDSNS